MTADGPTWWQQAIQDATDRIEHLEAELAAIRDLAYRSVGRPAAPFRKETDMHISTTGYTSQTRTLPNGDTIRLNDLVDGSSLTGEWDLTGRVIGWSPDGINIAYQNSSFTCAPDQVRLAVQATL